MSLQRSRVEILTERLLYFVLLLAVLTGLAQAQDTSSSSQPPAPKPVAPADNPSPSPTSVPPDSYIIGAEDVLSIYVWKEPDMSKTIPVRPDGMISLPLVGEIKAAGHTPVQLQDVLATAMKKYVSDPQVTVVVEKISSLSFNIVGEIAKPGFYPLTRRMTVLDAIAMAGGFKDFAKEEGIRVTISANGTQQRLPFNWEVSLQET